MNKPKLRCAIYTRKSSEEGLDQDFNSLDAQREACESYITSQKGEGWTLVRTRFDDGGYSGGNMDRPALKELLEALDAGRIDVVVVYKVDRLTRSLSDFARIIERFDAKKVSFVSVTQAFNTTSSMGRLTLNVLLSFAQFEREVTGERIRDKIAASKVKGMWMGGSPPLGYDVAGRTLKTNKKEAKTVQWIFQRYTELKSVDALVCELAQKKIRSKSRISTRGRQVGGFAIVRGAVNHMLRNPLYLGKIRHKEKLYAGQHTAIISQALWDRVQSTMADNRTERTQERVRAHQEWWLTGRLFDATGQPMTPTFTSRSNGKRYKYYAVQNGNQEQDRTEAAGVTRIRAEFIHALVEAAVVRGAQGAKRSPMKEDLVKVTVGSNKLRLEFRAARKNEHLGAARKSPEKLASIDVPIRIARQGHRSQIVPPADLELKIETDPRVVPALRQAWQWRQQIETGKFGSAEVLAEALGVTKRHVNKVLRLAFIPPANMAQCVGEVRS